MTKWKQVWESKKLFSSDKTLTSLIKTDGFDSVYAQYTDQDWLSMCEKINNIINDKQQNKILEVGCGAGALAYGFGLNKEMSFYGVDYSDSLINIAKSVMPEKAWIVAESCSLPFENDYFDSVVVHSVLQYMPNTEYFRQTISEILRVCKKGGKIILADIYDKDKEHEYYRLRSKAINSSVDEYINNNIDFKHMFFTKDFIYDIFKNNKSIEEIYLNTENNKYINSFYNFSVMVIK